MYKIHFCSFCVISHFTIFYVFAYISDFRKPHIFDNMIAMMEKYADNLEVLVDERTDQLIEEKKKTDALLYEMLPR